MTDVDRRTESLKHDKMQDEMMGELKGLCHTLSSKQQESHTDIVVLKMEVGNLKTSIDELKNEIHNGFAKKIMAEAYNNSVKTNNQLTSDIITILKNNSEKNSETIQTQNKSNNVLLQAIFSKGGFAVAVISGIIAAIVAAVKIFA